MESSNISIPQNAASSSAAVSLNDPLRTKEDQMLQNLHDILMEESSELDDQKMMMQEWRAYQAVAKGFYDILKEERFSLSSVGIRDVYKRGNPEAGLDLLGLVYQDFQNRDHSSLLLYANLPSTLTADATLSSLERKLSEESDATLMHQQEGPSSTLEKADAVDFRALLLDCGKVVGGNDVRKARHMIQEIRQHATPSGTPSERLAHYFAQALAARLSGDGARLYSAVWSNRPSALEMLKAHYLLVKVCPFLQLSCHFANFNILRAAEGATRLHIVDYGILYGFHWPSLMRALAHRAGGPPSLRITGIEFPLHGTKPTERLEDTGRRLAEYARTYGVPFEFQGVIESRWEKVTATSLQLQQEEGQVLVVSCMYRLRHLMDETVMPRCPRQQLLDNVRRMNPMVFLYGVVNAGCNASFATRLKEAVFHFSNIFDFLGSTIPKDNYAERLLLEREIFGREILNVVACEDLHRLERPETYRHWQFCTHRAGFEQLSLRPSMLTQAHSMMCGSYHKDYGIGEDRKWFLLAWKGRAIHALSAWRPSSSCL